MAAIATRLPNRKSLRVWERELWTARQRQMHPIHYTVSYRASFKPELPDYFIRKYAPRLPVLDPFGGRGTTAVQANLLGKSAIHNDLNPLAVFLGRARQRIAPLEELIRQTEGLNLKKRRFRLKKHDRERLLPFFHPDTLQELMNLRAQFFDSGGEDPGLNYIMLTALSRLHGHSDGFFSVYSFPQISVMPKAQERNNRKANLRPEYRNVQRRIVKKLRADLGRGLPESYVHAADGNLYLNCDARKLSPLKGGSVDLIVTSPPFLDKVNYPLDNWLRAWFLGLECWTDFMGDVMREMGRLLAPGGRAVIEVGEVSAGGSVLNLEELLMSLLPLKLRGGELAGDCVFINRQRFTKLANCWDVKNNEKGTNTNRCLVLQKVR